MGVTYIVGKYLLLRGLIPGVQFPRHGRTVGYPTTPAQIPACGINAPYVLYNITHTVSQCHSVAAYKVGESNKVKAATTLSLRGSPRFLELDNPRLLRVHRKPVLAKPFRQHPHHPTGILVIREMDQVRIDRCALHLTPHLFRHTINTLVQDYGHDPVKIRAVAEWMDEAVQDVRTHWDLDNLRQGQILSTKSGRHDKPAQPRLLI